MSWIIPVAWSLEVEVQFYILAPFLSLIFVLKKFSFRFALICLAIISSAFLQETALFKNSFSLQMSLLGWFQYFMIGFLLADIYLSQKIRLFLPKVIQLLIGLLLLAGLSFLPYEGAFNNRLIYVFLCFLFFLLVLHFPVWKGIFSLQYISIIGGMCYSIYLLHFATISFIGNYTIHLKLTDSLAINYLLQWVVILLAVLIVSGAYFLLIERPCMRKDWPQRLLKKIQGKPYNATLKEEHATVVKTLN
jgi:peptidoglycan/LPS O-acetylase OafA/YrhL